MADETWATFSIYDHRTALYRQALLLFDRVVMPVPAAAFGDLRDAELDALSADVEFLQKYDAAVPFAWDENTFQAWQASVTSEALATRLSKDPQLATRLQVADQILPLKPAGVESVTAVPVYGNGLAFSDLGDEMRRDGLRDAVLLEVVLPRLPVPPENAPLERIVDLRGKESFREAVWNLRKWQAKVLPDLLKDPDNRDRHLRAAAAEFDRWIRQYSEAVSDAKFAKLKTGVVSVLAVGAVLSPLTKPLITALSAIASPLFSLRELRKPTWKVVGDKACAPAAIVYESSLRG